MSDASDLRLARVEKEVSELYDTIENLKNTVSQLNITIALLQQTIQSLKTEADSRAAFNQRVILSSWWCGICSSHLCNQRGSCDMTHIFLKNLPMLLAGVILGVAVMTWVLWGYTELSSIDSLTLFIERSGEEQCHQ